MRVGTFHEESSRTLDVSSKEAAETNWRDDAKSVDLDVKSLIKSQGPNRQGSEPVVTGGLLGAGHSWTPPQFKNHRTVPCLQLPTGTSLL